MGAAPREVSTAHCPNIPRRPERTPLSQQTAQEKASQFSARMTQSAASSGKPALRMSGRFPHMLVTRPPLFVWIDRGRVMTSDGPRKGHQICSMMVDVREDSSDKRTIVFPALSDARRFAGAIKKAKFQTADQRNNLFAGRRATQVAIGTPWFSPVMILSRALSYRYWKPDDATDDIDSWARQLGVGQSARDAQTLERLLRLAIVRGPSWGSLSNSMNSTCERVLKSVSFPSAVNDAQTYSAMEAIGDVWRTISATDAQLRDFSVSSRKTVAVHFVRPQRPLNVNTAIVPSGSVPFREGSKVLIVHPWRKEGGPLNGGELEAFGFEDGKFVARVRPKTKGDRGAIAEAYGRTTYLIEAPFGAALKFGMAGSTSWEGGVPPTTPVQREVPADLLAIGAAR